MKIGKDCSPIILIVNVIKLMLCMLACCQFDPVLFNVEYNMKQASDLLKE
jgi:hypothetical protein